VGGAGPVGADVRCVGRGATLADVLIIGGGMCGLGMALLLARDGHAVTVVERDAEPPPGSPQEAWGRRERQGVAQFRQPHNFLPGLRLLLESELPDVQDALRHAGASRFDMLNPLPPFFTDQSPRPIDGCSGRTRRGVRWASGPSRTPHATSPGWRSGGGSAWPDC